MTPAALKAAASGDMENFVAAMTPGGIEAQEKRGQIEQCANRRSHQRFVSQQPVRVNSDDPNCQSSPDGSRNRGDDPEAQSTEQQRREGRRVQDWAATLPLLAND